MKIYSNYNPIRYVKSLYYANKNTTHYIQYPKAVENKTGVFTSIKNFLKKICSK